jgi:hypothetical protein
MNKDARIWGRFNNAEIYSYDKYHLQGLLILALEDISELALQVEYWREQANAHHKRNQEHVCDS